MITARPEPTYAYMKDAKGFCWAICAFIYSHKEIRYAWTVRAKCDRDHRPTAKKLLGYRLNHLWFGDESWRRPFREYKGKPLKSRIPLSAIRLERMDKCGTWRDSPDAFRGALERIRNRIATLNVDYYPPVSDDEGEKLYKLWADTYQLGRPVRQDSDP